MRTQFIFVLVGTTHSGNIGAAARAIKNMAFSELRLVDTCAHLTKDALARASGADGLLISAQRFSNLDDAVADCHSVVGTSARQRQLAVPVQDCRDVVNQLARTANELLLKSAGDGAVQCCDDNLANDDLPLLQAGQDALVNRVALVFGRERSGLSNEELDRCTHLLRIPCNPEFSSLNLGSAVQVVAYELAMAMQLVEPSQLSPSDNSANEQPASSEAMQYFYEHLQKVMENTGFWNPKHPRNLMRRVKRYFERNRPSVNELNILRGVLAATEKSPRGDS